MTILKRLGKKNKKITVQTQCYFYEWQLHHNGEVVWNDTIQNRGEENCNHYSWKYLVISAKQIVILNVATVKGVAVVITLKKIKKNTISQLNETKDGKVKFLDSLLKMLPTLV